MQSRRRIGRLVNSFALKLIVSWWAFVVQLFRRGPSAQPRCCACGVDAADEHYTRIAWRRHACRSCWRELVRVGDARAVRAVRARLRGISSRHALALARLADEFQPCGYSSFGEYPTCDALECQLGYIARHVVGVGPDPYAPFDRGVGAHPGGSTTSQRPETVAADAAVAFVGEAVDHPIPYGLTDEGRAAARSAGCTCSLCVVQSFFFGKATGHEGVAS